MYNTTYALILSERVYNLRSLMAATELSRERCDTIYIEYKAKEFSKESRCLLESR